MAAGWMGDGAAAGGAKNKDTFIISSQFLLLSHSINAQAILVRKYQTCLHFITMVAHHPLSIIHHPYNIIYHLPQPTECRPAICHL